MMSIESLLKKYAYKTGEFVLASGQKSNEYLDVKNALHHPYAAPFIVRAVTYDGHIQGQDCVAGVAVGGVPLATLVAADLNRRHSKPCFPLTVRLEAKAHGTKGSIDGIDNVMHLAKPRRVVLLEDVITTGGSTRKALDVLRDHELLVDHVICVVDREQGGIDALKKDYPEIRVTALTTMSAVRGAAES